MPQFSIRLPPAAGHHISMQRHRKLRAGAASPETSPVSPEAQGKGLWTAPEINWKAIRQVAGVVGTAGGILTPVGIGIWKASGVTARLFAQGDTLRTALATQADTTQKSIDRLQKSVEGVSDDLKALDGRVTGLAISVGEIRGPCASDRKAAGPKP